MTKERGMTHGPIGFEFNGIPEVLGQLAFPDDVFIVDSTIRSLQSTLSGSRHSVETLVRVGTMVSDLGARELIVNATWRDGLDVIRELKHRGISAKVVS